MPIHFSIRGFLRQNRVKIRVENRLGDPIFHPILDPILAPQKPRNLFIYIRYTCDLTTTYDHPRTQYFLNLSI
jgi:hypothetical protein